MLISFRALLVVAAAGLAMTSCGAVPTLSLRAVAGGTTGAAQASALADGVIDFAEYQAGYERYVSCVSEAGYEITLAGENNKVFDSRMNEDAADSKAVADCYTFEFEGVDRIWQLSREDTSPGAAQAEKCLRKWRLKVPVKYADRVKLLDRERIELFNCEKR
jgi:hypothetical protein